MQISLAVLGNFSVMVDDQPIAESRTKKIEALLAYLVVEVDYAHRREKLMGLLFPEMDDDAASTNLRQTLTRLRRTIQDQDGVTPFLTVTRESIQFNRASDHRCDLYAFKALLTGCEEHTNQRSPLCSQCMANARQAIDLYRGPFLTDLFLADSAEFEDWAHFLREYLQQSALAVLDDLIQFHTRRGEYAQAITYGQRQVQIEPWREETHQRLMRLLARLGQRAHALAQYKSCADALARELAVEPAPETTALRQQIAELTENVRSYHLPRIEDTFIGRKDELAHIYMHFADEASRLLTLVGGGGVGKTRLALEVGWRIAHELLGPFIHGVYFVSLANLGATGDGEKMLSIAVADSLGLSLVGVQTPLDSIKGYLRNKELLLIVDNCEEAGDAIRLLSQLLAQAPGLQILATSREPLHLQNEFLLRIDGLPFPPGEATSDDRPSNIGSRSTSAIEPIRLEEYHAVQLFSHHAQRMSTNFSVDKLVVNEQHAVARICRICEGMPLALEMAAAWVPLLPCQEIASEIARNFDLLQNSRRDHEPRHRSIRAVFDYSWQRLTDAEQALFARLSVFRGGFDLEAAREVAAAPLSVLASLVRKSLLHYHNTRTSQSDSSLTHARYAFHPLLHQYAAEKLAEHESAGQIQQRHGAYYCTWLSKLTPHLNDGAQQKAIAAIALELDNLRQAWHHAVDDHQIELIAQAVEGFTIFCELRGLFSEGEALLRQAVEALRAVQRTDEDDATAIVAAKTLARQGRLNFLLGHSALAQKQLAESIGILRVLEVEEELTTPLNYLAYLAYCTDQYPQALRLTSEAGEIAQKFGDRLGEANAYRTKAAVMEVKGEVSAGLKQYERALAAYQEIDNPQGICWSLLSLCSCAISMRDYEAAIARSKEVIKLSRQIGFRLVEGWALYGLGRVYIHQSEYGNALECFEQALKIGHSINDTRQQASVLHWWGTCKRCQNELVAANGYYEQALILYRQIRNVLGEGMALNDMGILARYNGDYLISQKLCQRALAIGQEIGNLDLQQRVFISLGHLYTEQERYVQAKVAYEHVLEMKEDIQFQTHLHSLLGLALIAIRQDKIETAHQYVDKLIPLLHTQAIDGADELTYLQRIIHQITMVLHTPRLELLFKTIIETNVNVQDRLSANGPHIIKL